MSKFFGCFWPPLEYGNNSKFDSWNLPVVFTEFRISWIPLNWDIINGFTFMSVCAYGVMIQYRPVSKKMTSACQPTFLNGRFFTTKLFLTCNTAVTIALTSDKIIPISMPNGEASEKIPIKVIKTKLLIFVLAKVNPKQKAITNLWAQTAKKSTKNEDILVCKPMAIPSIMEWKDRASCKIMVLIMQWCPKSTWECPSWLE